MNIKMIIKTISSTKRHHITNFDLETISLLRSLATSSSEISSCESNGGRIGYLAKNLEQKVKIYLKYDI